MEAKPSNNPNDIAETYAQHRVSSSLNIAGGEMEVKSMMKEFFSTENTIKRLLLQRKYINKSENKRKVTLEIYYINMTHTDKIAAMVYLGKEKEALAKISEFQIAEKEKQEKIAK
jgi:hypothetical protein